MIKNYDKAKEMFLQGISLIQIQKKLGIDRKKLSTCLKQEGYEIKLNNSKYSCNENFFNTINTEHKAYWLGFLYADGSIENFGRYKIDLTISDKDKDHLLKYKESLQLTYPINKRSQTLNGNTYYSHRVTITNKTLVEDIIKQGCVPNKSLILTFPTEKQVPKHLIRHFIRGYFDGDGCITMNSNNKTYNFNILGTYDFLTAIQNEFVNSIDNYKSTKISKDNRSEVYKFQKGKVCGTKQINDIYNYLYKDCTIYLDRKKNIFEKVIQKS